MAHHDDMTFHGLSDHTKHLIEKFGYMVIHHHHHDGKHRGSLLCYAGAIYRHVKALEHAMTEFRETSSKHRDIRIMHDKLRTLWNAALKHFALEAREVLEDLGEEVIEAAENVAQAIQAIQASPEYDRLRNSLTAAAAASGSRPSGSRMSALGLMSGTSDGAGSPSRSRSPTRTATGVAMASSAAVRSGSGSRSRMMSDRVASSSSEDDDIAQILNSARSGSPTRSSVSSYLPSRVASRASGSGLA